MYSHKAVECVALIAKKVTFIENIVNEYGTVSLALEDEQNGRASILMHLTSISEQFDKLLHSGELEILSMKKRISKGVMSLETSLPIIMKGSTSTS